MVSRDRGPTYRYLPLNRARREIRLVKFRPFPAVVNSGETIEPWCELRHASLSDEYTALSYTWGNPTKCKKIWINDAPLPITQSLYDALCFLPEARESWIWIDAICINQEDVDEKSWQVAMMREIYRNPSRVIAWLGLPADGSDSVFDSLNRLCLEDTAAILDTFESDDTARMAELLQFRGNFVPGPDNRITDANAIVPLPATSRLLQRPYWERIWTKQETAMLMKRHIFFACGTKRIKLFGLLLAMRLLDSIARGSIPLHQTYSPREPTSYERWGRICSVFDLHALHLTFYAGGSLTLFDGMQHSRTATPYDIQRKRSLKAADPRDVVFGLLQLSEEFTELGVEVDYAQPCWRVYAELTARSLLTGTEHSKLDMLRWAEGPKRIQGLPSWVPDFSSLPHAPLDLSFHGFSWSFCACGREALGGSTNSSRSSNGSSNGGTQTGQGSNSNAGGGGEGPQNLPLISVSLDRRSLFLPFLPLTTITAVSAPLELADSFLDLNREEDTVSSDNPTPRYKAKAGLSSIWSQMSQYAAISSWIASLVHLPPRPAFAAAYNVPLSSLPPAPSVSARLRFRASLLLAGLKFGFLSTYSRVCSALPARLYAALPLPFAVPKQPFPPLLATLAVRPPPEPLLGLLRRVPRVDLDLSPEQLPGPRTLWAESTSQHVYSPEGGERQGEVGTGGNGRDLSDTAPVGGPAQTHGYAYALSPFPTLRFRVGHSAADVKAATAAGKHLAATVRLASGGRRGFGCATGWVGVGPGGVRKGDVVGLVMGRTEGDGVAGCRACVVLRRKSRRWRWERKGWCDGLGGWWWFGEGAGRVDDMDGREGEGEGEGLDARANTGDTGDAWELIGEAYVHGIMEGEALRGNERWREEVKVVRVV
ncbi:heterokaryon incompatibility protein-domain-containing protein [Lineolata rhizophorae]|uniref:Heterokaryon incompatibility protein-domain-containing protein n=1 Tax=Lineolata rhizophorae TaxID=578093 RepID=A0A6A6NX09_9PEZI|nr:heterokaryon incompatibility protein-domain-containing protein [Lineolata rhizophorae]